MLLRCTNFIAVHPVNNATFILYYIENNMGDILLSYYQKTFLFLCFLLCVYTLDNGIPFETTIMHVKVIL